MLYLVRHAKAGSRSEWVGDDRLRPLSGKGRTQSDALAERLAPLATGELVSSPYLRCIETLQPLAARTRQRRARRRATRRGHRASTVRIALLAELPDGSVLCSHGDVIPETIGALQRRGHRHPHRARLAQGQRVGAQPRRRRQFTEATVWPPPDE